MHPHVHILHIVIHLYIHIHCVHMNIILWYCVPLFHIWGPFSHWSVPNTSSSYMHVHCSIVLFSASRWHHRASRFSRPEQEPGLL